MASTILAYGLRLIRDLYDAADDPRAWQATLTELNGNLSGQHLIAAEVAAHPSASDPGLLLAADDVGVASRLLRDPGQPDPYDTPTMRRRLIAARRVFHGHELVAPMELQASAFHAERLVPAGQLAHSLCTTFEVEPGVLLRVVQWRPVRRPFSETERQALDMLAPPLLGAARLRRASRRVDEREALQQGLFDVFNDALFIVDADARIRFRNDAAARWMANMAIDGPRLQLTGADGSDLLAPRLRQVVQAGPGSMQEAFACFALVRADLAETFVTVTRLPAQARRNGAEAAVFVRDLARAWPLGALDALREAFALTPAETRVAGCLAEGLDAGECAERLGISVETVRHHTKQLLQKTRTRRQSELVRLLVKAVPNVRGTQPIDPSTAIDPPPRKTRGALRR
jgi:DNA-binding CsgD family transcriptional regulator/PAS domain-containing protein